MGNQLRTVFLLSVLTVLLVLLGSIFGRVGAIFALILAFGLNFLAYFFSDRIVLSAYRAKEISEDENPQLFSVVRELVTRAGLPMPKVYIVPLQNPNAFATGRDPKHAAVAVTHGILKILNENELKGVLGHELTHILHRDTLISTIAATIAGAITYISRFGLWGSMFGDDDRGSNPLFLLLLILMPIAALLIQLAISRSREYLADEGGAKISGDPIYLADALEKLAYSNKKFPTRGVNPSTSHMFIVNPLKGNGIFTLFSTHPPIEERIRRLRGMAGRY